MDFNDDQSAVIIDNFKGQVTSINDLQEKNNIHVYKLPPNTTDLLQLMDLSINKPAKDYLRRRFEEWYSQQGKDIDSIELELINLGLPILKELGAKWLVDMHKYIEMNPQIIVNGFIHLGIAGALDGLEDCNPDDNETMMTNQMKNQTWKNQTLMVKNQTWNGDI